MATQAISIPLPRPHKSQAEILAFKGNAVVFAGRRFGKTQVGIYKLLRESTQLVGLYWWVGLSWRSASMKRAWRLLKYYVRKIYRALNLPYDGKIRETEKELYLPNGSAIWLRSSEREDSLAGEGIRGVVVDEFPYMQSTVWTEFLDAALLDNNGWVLFIGKPNGNNWAAALWAQAKARPNWKQFHFTSYDNPKIPRERIDEKKAFTPEAIFNQEYLALPMQEGSVFRNVEACATAVKQDSPIAGHSYLFGMDTAKLNDYSVVTVYDTTLNEVVYIDRFSQIDYVLQLTRLEALYLRFKPSAVIIESNNAHMFIEEAQRRGIPVISFNTNPASKQMLIDALVLVFEQGLIKIINDTDLISELNAFAAERLPGGGLRYSAPSGLHDDCVMSLALVNYHTKTYVVPDFFVL